MTDFEAKAWARGLITAMDMIKESALQRIQNVVTTTVKKNSLRDLLRVYRDLESTLAALKTVADSNSTFRQIDVRNAIQKITQRKQVLERKIGNMLLLEKHNIKRKVNRLLTS